MDGMLRALAMKEERIMKQEIGVGNSLKVNLRAPATKISTPPKIFPSDNWDVQSSTPKAPRQQKMIVGVMRVQL